jgi:hypothetical protein
MGVTAFGGIDLGLKVPEGSWANTQNLTSAEYPIAATRKKRGILRKLESPGGIIGKSKLFWIENNHIWYDGGQYDEVTPGEKQLVSMGAWVLIFPDKVAFNTDTLKLKTMENRTSPAGKITVKLAKEDGSVYEGYATGEDAPADPKNGDLWFNDGIMQVFSSATSAWTQVETLYGRIEGTGIGIGFSQYDGVTITGCAADDMNGEKLLQRVEDDAILVIGVVSQETSQEGGVTVKREVPQMDHVTSLNNRCWGCSTYENEIYACKLGDPTNWKAYEGLSTDAYAVNVGSDGPFTGAATQGGKVVFFKPGCVHEIYGQMPANFQVTQQECRGVEQGSERSLVLVDEVLYYKSADGVMGYDGSLPQSVSSSLEGQRFRNARAGKQGSRYYISMEDMQGKWHLFTLDTRSGMWLREDDTKVKWFASCQGDGYFVRADDVLMAIEHTAAGTAFDDVGQEADFEWLAETGDLMDDIRDNKWVSRIQLRMQMTPGSEASVFMQFDGCEWKRAVTVAWTDKRTVTLPIAARRCDHLRMRLAGKGEVSLYQLSRYVEQGSEF